jgi:hypothetical protein
VERAEKQAIGLKLRIDSPPAPTFRQYFIEAIRTRKPTPLDGHLGYRSQVAVALGVEAYRQNRVMFFDTKKEQISARPPV